MSADPRSIIARVRGHGANVELADGGLRIINRDKLPAGAETFVIQHAPAIVAVLRADAGEREPELPPPPAETVVPMPTQPFRVFGATLFDMADLCFHEAFLHGDEKMRAAANVLSMLSLDEAATQEFLGHIATARPDEARLLKSMLVPSSPVEMEHAA